MTELKRYNALKQVTAKPMNRQEYNDLRGWQLPADENGSDEGYLTVDINGEPNLAGYDGYVSWTPKAMFDKQFVHYFLKPEVCIAPKDDRDLTDDEVMRNPEQFEELGFNLADEFDFGLAICAIKQGKKVARKSWNGAGMFVYYTPAGCFPNKHLAKVKVDFPDDIIPYREFLALKTAQGDVAVWTPSTSDALAEDWMLVE